MHGYPLDVALHPQSFRAVGGKWSPSASPLVLEGPLTRHLAGSGQGHLGRLTGWLAAPFDDAAASWPPVDAVLETL